MCVRAVCVLECACLRFHKFVTLVLLGLHSIFTCLGWGFKNALSKFFFIVSQDSFISVTVIMIFIFYSNL